MKKLNEQLAHYLKISSFDKDRFVYYILNDDYEESWDIIGFRSVHNNVIDIRLMHVDDDMLEDEQFSSEGDSSSYISFDINRCKQFISFLEQVVLQNKVRKIDEIHEFHLLDAIQLRNLHYPETLLKTGVGYWYKYTDKSVSVEKESIRLVGLPSWKKEYRLNQSNSLWFVTLEPSHLDDEHFNLIRSSYGLGTISFTRRALEELISMLYGGIQEILL
jgi:hypothetical protein